LNSNLVFVRGAQKVRPPKLAAKVPSIGAQQKSDWPAELIEACAALLTRTKAATCMVAALHGLASATRGRKVQQDVPPQLNSGRSVHPSLGSLAPSGLPTRDRTGRAPCI